MPPLPTTTTRVSSNTAAEVNHRIRKAMEARVEDIVRQGNGAINQRLRELEQEWDIERCLEAGASTLIITGLALGLAKDRRWLLLPAAGAAFLLQHALKGWSPPLPALRRLGVRTPAEINEERIALKTLRGDFYDVSTQPSSTVAQAIHAVRR